MKIRVLSDLHLEFLDWIPPLAHADVVVLAGDIHLGARGMEWARREFPVTPILYVPGNHEFYGGQFQNVMTLLREAAERLGIRMLDEDEFILDDTRFLGATLWTDFALNGSEPAELKRAMLNARFGMNDYRVIRYGEMGQLRPQHTRDIHLRQASWLTEKLHEPFVGSTVVITHHLPHRGSINLKYENDSLNPCFSSDLSRLVKEPVSLWIHGHTHDSCDYVANGTRVVCNPRGYLPMEPNTAFDPTLVVEVR